MPSHTVKHATIRARQQVRRNMRSRYYGTIVHRNPEFKRERGLYFQGRPGGMGVVIFAPGYRVV